MNPTNTLSDPPGTVNNAALDSTNSKADQLNIKGDEYVVRETDDAGEKKITTTGQILGDREYRCRTFVLPNRGEKLFMLSIECARVLGYENPDLLFNENSSLFEIIATQAENDDLIHQDILPYAYRPLPVGIVTASSMFRRFGSRLIYKGRRVRDDYWETKAREQGFTEEDPTY
ncbi:chromatin remodelling complex Rsc7/Swp82 subunit-domain-containing protein [Phaeosphaeriaceae sp. PMI808]|nr:chromatin remodelling complex Rsc7/Swp82 subunit-domain-containing protein [Phaeosphaeriaceae sp. PMI808]